MKELSLTLCVLSALLGGISSACAQEAMQPVEAVQPVWRTDVTSNITQRLELFKLVPGGQAQNIRLTGVNNRQVFDFGVRNDELLSKAVLELNFTASPALIAGRSQINVLLNGQVQRSLAITPEMLGKRFNAQIMLDPNTLRQPIKSRLSLLVTIKIFVQRPRANLCGLRLILPAHFCSISKKLRLLMI